MDVGGVLVAFHLFLPNRDVSVGLLAACGANVHCWICESKRSTSDAALYDPLGCGAVPVAACERLSDMGFVSTYD